MKKYGVYGKDGSCLFIGSWEDCSGMARSPGGFVRVYCGEPIVPVGGLTEEPNSAENHDALLRAFEDSLITTAITIGYEAVNWTSEEYDVHPLVVKTRAARLSLVNYITDLEKFVAGKGIPDEYAVDCSADSITPNMDRLAATGITHKTYVAISMADPEDQGSVFATWPSCKEHVSGKSHMAYQKLHSYEEIDAWFTAKKFERIARMVNVDVNPPPLRLDIDGLPIDDDSPPWELEKDGQPVDGGEDDRLLDKPPWEVKRSKPFPKM